MILEKFELKNAFVFDLSGKIKLSEQDAEMWRNKGVSVQKHKFSGRLFWDNKVLAIPASELRLVQSNDNLAAFVVVDANGNQLLEKSLSCRSKYAIRKESDSAFTHRAYNAFGQLLCVLEDESQVMSFDQFKPIFDSEYPFDEIFESLAVHGIIIVEVLPSQYIKI